MQFTKCQPNIVAPMVAATLTSALGRGNVLWLVSGGSNAAMQIEVMALLPTELTARLTVLPMDERYGPYDHEFSNTATMRRAGFDPKNAEWIDLLQDTPDREHAVSLLKKVLLEHATDEIIGTFGLGADGHTAGILPNSPAVNAPAIAIGYDGPDFSRVTLTIAAVKQYVKIAYVYAFGESKTNALNKLRSNAGSLSDTPALVLNSIPNCTVYNGVIGG